MGLFDAFTNWYNGTKSEVAGLAQPVEQPLQQYGGPLASTYGARRLLKTKKEGGGRTSCGGKRHRRKKTHRRRR